MRKEEKQLVIDELSAKFSEGAHVYVTDTSGMTVAEINALRRLCFSKGVELKVAKNTLIKKAFIGKEVDMDSLDKVLHGPTSLIFSTNANLPAKLIEEFRKDKPKPALKGAVIGGTDIYVGEENLETLKKLKSKEELIGEIIGLLQSPAKNVISALQSGGHKLSGLLKALEERGEKQ
ncbi:MAG: 50S ribosomal protein L10 [Chitinophagales bacterium]|nr:50S ribosomal protein L10 [Chitinophagales bacterium]